MKKLTKAGIGTVTVATALATVLAPTAQAVFAEDAPSKNETVATAVDEESAEPKGYSDIKQEYFESKEAYAEAVKIFEELKADMEKAEAGFVEISKKAEDADRAKTDAENVFRGTLAGALSVSTQAVKEADAAEKTCAEDVVAKEAAVAEAQKALDGVLTDEARAAAQEVLDKAQEAFDAATAAHEKAAAEKERCRAECLDWIVINDLAKEDLNAAANAVLKKAGLPDDAGSVTKEEAEAMLAIAKEDLTKAEAYAKVVADEKVKAAKQLQDKTDAIAAIIAAGQEERAALIAEKTEAADAANAYLLEVTAAKEAKEAELAELDESETEKKEELEAEIAALEEDIEDATDAAEEAQTDVEDAKAITVEELKKSELAVARQVRDMAQLMFDNIDKEVSKADAAVIVYQDTVAEIEEMIKHAPTAEEDIEDPVLAGMVKDIKEMNQKASEAVKAADEKTKEEAALKEKKENCTKASSLCADILAAKELYAAALKEMLTVPVFSEDSYDWTRHTETPLTINCSGRFNEFEGILLDGEEIPLADLVVKPGAVQTPVVIPDVSIPDVSVKMPIAPMRIMAAPTDFVIDVPEEVDDTILFSTTVSIAPEFLDDLDEGAHEITMLFGDIYTEFDMTNTASAILKVQEDTYECGAMISSRDQRRDEGGSVKISYSFETEDGEVEVEDIWDTATTFKVPKGTEVKMEALPDEGYHFMGWYLPSEGEQAEAGFVYDETVLLSEEDEYSFIINPKDGILSPYAVAVFEKDSEEQRMVTSAHILTSSYEGFSLLGEEPGGRVALEYIPTSEPNEMVIPKDGKTFSFGQDAMVYMGDEVTAIALPNEGYRFVGWFRLNDHWSPADEIPRFTGEPLSEDLIFSFIPGETVMLGDVNPLRSICAVFAEEDITPPDDGENQKPDDEKKPDEGKKDDKPAAPANQNNGQNGANGKQGNTVKTGDESHMGLFAAISGVAAVAAGAFIGLKKKLTKEDK